MTRERMDQASLGRLKWRCRRGLLENDLLIERFFARHGNELTQRMGQTLTRLMDLPDNELLDLLLGRHDLHGDLDTPEMHQVLNLMRPAPGSFAAA